MADGASARPTAPVVITGAALGLPGRRAAVRRHERRAPAQRRAGHRRHPRPPAPRDARQAHHAAGQGRRRHRALRDDRPSRRRDQARTFNQASSRSVRMPSARAALRISQLLARSWASWRTASVVYAQLENALPADEAELPAGAAALRPVERLAALLETRPRESPWAGRRASARTARGISCTASAPAAGPSRLRPCWPRGTARRPYRPAACRRSAASFVCSVLNTRWPVSDAWIAFSAVSISRISPTSTTSGS